MKQLFSVLFLLAAIIPCGAIPATDVEKTPCHGAVNINVDTHLTLTFNSIPEIGKSGMIRVFEAASGRQVDSLDLSIPAGPTQSRTYGHECDYTKVPYDYTRTHMPTNRDTRPGTPSGTAEPTPPTYQLNIIGGFTDAFHFYPIIVKDSTATIYLHNNMLDYDHTYYVTIDKGVLTVPDGSFNGITKADGWTFTTKPSAPDRKDTLTVDAAGNGDFNTIQGALDFIPDFSDTPTVIIVKQGDYEELVYARNKTNIKIKGEGIRSTKVHYANNEVFNPHPLTVKTNEWPGTFPSRRAAFALDNCNDIIIEDITIATDLKGQAEGLLLNGERIALYNVHIIGSGDALQANGTIYMEECQIDGDGDTVLGRGSLFAYKSDLRNNGGPFTWVRNTEGHHGDVFVECTFSTNNGRMADFGRTPANHGSTYPHAEIVLIDCLTNNIRPEGWSIIGEKTAQMYEYNTRDMNTGNKVDTSKRHPYSRQLDAETDAKLISNYRTPASILNGWQPKAHFQLR